MALSSTEVRVSVMRIGSLPALVLALAASNTPAAAADIKLFCSRAIDAIIEELGPQFERASGHKLVLRYGVGSILKREIEAGAAFDAAILVGAIDDLVKAGKIVAGTSAVLGRTGYGVAVRKGAPKPDISSTEAFRRTLLNARAVTFNKDGGSGTYFVRLLDRLGIAEEMKPKLMPSPDSARLVATGEADLTVNGLTPILRAPGIELVGPLPSELQSYSVFVAGVGAAAKDGEAATTFVRFLTTPAALAVFKSRGVEPVAP